MSGKKRASRGIESLEKQIAIHKEKMRKATEKGSIGLVTYYEKEIQNFERVKERLKFKIFPKSKRKKR